MNVTQTLDAKGLSCPMPVVRTKKMMDTLQAGEVLELHTTDTGACNDIPAWAKTSGNTILDSKEENGVYIFWIQKG